MSRGFLPGVPLFLQRGLFAVAAWVARMNAMELGLIYPTLAARDEHTGKGSEPCEMINLARMILYFPLNALELVQFFAIDCTDFIKFTKNRDFFEQVCLRKELFV
jgi:hypothetical protein